MGKVSDLTRVTEKEFICFLENYPKKLVTHTMYTVMPMQTLWHDTSLTEGLADVVAMYREGMTYMNITTEPEWFILK